MSSVRSLALVAAAAAIAIGCAGPSAPGEAVVYGGPPYPGLTKGWLEQALAEHAAHGHAETEEAGEEHGDGEGHHHHGNPDGPFTAAQLKHVVELHVARVARRDGGVFVVRDPVRGRDLFLTLRRVLDPVFRHDHLGYFLRAEFDDAAAPDRRYILDFWLTYPNFKLEVTGLAIQAEETRSDSGWVVEPRYRPAVEGMKPLRDAAS
ncbi:MAG: hypothetical protein D6718_02075 [Acidobacteria bacterium]|nr:MAG: hypothetical protein D6718_02075 [Acidobacteriota bacterium]